MREKVESVRRNDIIITRTWYRDPHLTRISAVIDLRQKKGMEVVLVEYIERSRNQSRSLCNELQMT